MTIIAGILLFIGGIMLILKKYLGGFFSLSGGILWFLSQVIYISWAPMIEERIDISLTTQYDLVVTAMCFICNLFCLILPLISMFAPAGRAAGMSAEGSCRARFITHPLLTISTN